MIELQNKYSIYITVVEYIINSFLYINISIHTFGAIGCCFICNIIERILETSLLPGLAFGLKSQSLAILSHSVPGSISLSSATNCFSAFLSEK